MKKKYHIFVIMIMLLSLMMCTGVSAATKNADKKGTWKKTAQGVRYVYKNGKYPKKAWKTINKKRYYFDKAGYRKTGWLTLNGRKYYFSSEGVMKTGWVKIKGRKYHFGKSGILDRNRWVGKYYVRFDGTILEESAHPTKMKEGYLTRSMLDEIDLSSCYNLMVVAHPDDETLWGGAHLTEGGYFVVCLTNGNKAVRKAEFETVIRESGNKGVILSYPDVTKGVRNNWNGVKSRILSDLNLVMQYKKWATVVTHNPSGEYGHIHHIMTNKFVTYVYHKNYWVNRLYYFGRFHKKQSMKKFYASVEKIPTTQYKEKKRLLGFYHSQKKVVEKMRQMHPYENWILEQDWE